VEPFEPIIGDSDQPLVSVLIYNYNYGCYLEECLNSVISQTYKNIEIVFSDNASSDNSWEIVSEFAKKYPGRFTIHRNAANFGPGINFEVCIKSARGDFFVPLASDDALMPDFVRQCLVAFKAEPQLGFAMAHYISVDAEGNRSDVPPFYNRSCVINGADQAAVYMMAAVNPSMSQVMYERLKFFKTAKTIGAFVRRWYGMRILDFNLCLKYPMAYISEPLVFFRIHGKNDSLRAGEDLLEVLGPYILVKQFYETAQILNIEKVTARHDAAIDKLALLSLRYCVRHLVGQNPIAARRYFYLAPSLRPEILESSIYIALNKYWDSSESEKTEILRTLYETNELLARTTSYDPPAGSIDLFFE